MATRAKATEKKAGAGKFLRGVWTELKKVNWPTRKELTAYVGVVLFMCTVTAVILGTFDSIFKYAVGMFL